MGLTRCQLRYHRTCDTISEGNLAGTGRRVAAAPDQALLHCHHPSASSSLSVLSLTLVPRWPWGRRALRTQRHSSSEQLRALITVPAKSYLPSSKL